MSRSFMMPTAVTSFETDAMRIICDGSIGCCLLMSEKPKPRA